MRVLAVRTDSDGDVLLTGPAVRALAHGAAQVDLLVSPAGAAAARLLPGAGEVLVFDPPWSGFAPPPVDPPAVHALVGELARRRYDLAVVLTSFHQSPLPVALLARLAGIARVVADCEDHPGSLLDLRHHRREEHEVEAALRLVSAAGFDLPPGDDGRLRVAPDPAPEVGGLPDGAVVVLHPGASVPARALAPAHARDLVRALRAAGHPVVVTGGPAEGRAYAAAAALADADLTGRTTLGELARVLERAAVLVAGNTGPAHLAAAVGTPVVSLFAPVVPLERWRPYGVPVVVLGDQRAACRGTRARACPVAGHPCLSGVDPADVVRAVGALLRERSVA